MVNRQPMSHQAAKAFYDQLGAAQDKGSYFEAPALAILREEGAFATAHRVFEFGCGTGSFAVSLLANALPAQSFYCGLDQSTTMVSLAAAKLARFGQRAAILHSDGSMVVPLATASVDRFVCNYVLDLLSAEDIAQLLTAAHQTLCDGGLLCLASLTHGTTPRSRLTMAGWELLYSIQPQRVGGCRPIVVTNFLDPTQWQLRHRAISLTHGLASEVVIAERR